MQKFEYLFGDVSYTDESIKLVEQAIERFNKKNYNQAPSYQLDNKNGTLAVTVSLNADGLGFMMLGMELEKEFKELGLRS